MSSFIELPDDCLYKIFLNLKSYGDQDAFGLTCRRCLQIQNFLRRSLVFQPFHRSGENAELYAIYLPRLLTRFPNLISISLANCTDINDTTLRQLRASGSKLRTLLLYCCLGISDDALYTVAAGCPNLVTVSLYKCRITDAGLTFLSKSCPSLENINLSCCLAITDNGIGALSKFCRQISTVMISNCKYIKGTGFYGCSPTLACLEADSCRLTSEGLLGVVSGGGLEYLNVSNLSCWPDIDCLISIRFASRLRYLNFRLCRFVGNELVDAIAKGCLVLEVWNLAVCHEVRLAGWEAIGLNCRNLKILHVNRCRNLCDQGLQALRDGCGQLKVLYMHCCGRVSSHGLETFKLLRQDVEVKREEPVTIGPCFDHLFSH